MKRFAIVYLGTLVILVPLDFVFLGAIGKKLFAEHVGDMTLTTPRIAPAILFYVLYLAGVAIFVNGGLPSDWKHNLLYGAMFGLFWTVEACDATGRLAVPADLGDRSPAPAEWRLATA